MFCKICGGAIDFEVESINGTHAGMDYCVVILNARVNHEQARAEAAETTLRTIRWHMEPHDPRMATEEDIVNLLREFAQVTEAMYEAQEKAEAAERRVAELEAAFEWRPVTGDDLPEDHDEALVTVENEDGYRFVDMAEFTVGGTWWQRVDTGWRELKRVTHWRQLPPPPAATE